VAELWSKRAAAATALFACALATPACRRPAASTSVRIAHESDALSLDPTSAQESVTHSILSNFYEPLVAFDRDMSLKPVLATAWNAVDDRTWVFQLRHGVRFHDGKILTAADVKQSLERARIDPSRIKGQLSTVEAVDAVDDHTLRLRTHRPDPLVIVRLTYVLVARGFGADDRAARPLGTGPYKIVRWDRGQSLEADAYGDYWNGRPAIDRASFVPVEEGGASVEALRAGHVDILRWVPETMAKDVSALPGVRIQSRAGLASYYLWFNTEAPKTGGATPFADRRVRRAVSLAIDRTAIIKGLDGNGVVATQLVQKGVFGHVSSLPDLGYDADQARKLLQEAGWGAGFDTVLVHRSQASVTTVARIVRDMLVSVGIRVALDTPEWPVVVSGWTEGRLPFFLAGWRFESGDAASFLRDCLYTRDAEHGTGAYNAGYSNRHLDRLIDENDQIFGEANRLKHYEMVMRVAMDEMPLVPLYHRLNLYGVSRRVRWEPRLDGKMLAAEMVLAQQ
jgi:peptide/nickel transport system substrate-binding protein